MQHCRDLDNDKVSVTNRITIEHAKKKKRLKIQLPMLSNSDEKYSTTADHCSSLSSLTKTHVKDKVSESEFVTKSAKQKKRKKPASDNDGKCAAAVSKPDVRLKPTAKRVKTIDEKKCMKSESSRSNTNDSSTSFSVASSSVQEPMLSAKSSNSFLPSKTKNNASKEFDPAVKIKTKHAHKARRGGKGNGKGREGEENEREGKGGEKRKSASILEETLLPRKKRRKMMHNNDGKTVDLSLKINRMQTHEGNSETEEIIQHNVVSRRKQNFDIIKLRSTLRQNGSLCDVDKVSEQPALCNKSSKNSSVQKHADAISDRT